MTLQDSTVTSKVASSSQEALYSNFVTCVTVSATVVKILEMYPSGVYSNSFEKSFPSNIFLSGFNPICKDKSKKSMSW